MLQMPPLWAPLLSADCYHRPRPTCWRERIIALRQRAFLKPVVDHEAWRAGPERVCDLEYAATLDVLLDAVGGLRVAVTQPKPDECSVGWKVSAGQFGLDVNLAAPRDASWPQA